MTEFKCAVCKKLIKSKKRVKINNKRLHITCAKKILIKRKK